jgi:membrane fusion protein, multidrug efflux system
MAKKIGYVVFAIVGIAAASGAAWWYQGRASGPTEIGASAPATASSASGSASAPAGAASGPRAAGVEVAKVEKMSLQDDAQAVGSLRSRQSVMLRPEVPGRVRELGFTDGARVRKGQMLVQLDDVLQRAEVRQGMAQLAVARANHKRNQELVAQNFLAQRVVDESFASLQVVEAQLALSCARLSRMSIVAPFDGVAGIRNINLGDYVKDGADLVNLEDISSLYVDFRLPERFQNKLRPEQPVRVTLDAFPGRVFKAKIAALDPLLDANGRSVGVRAVMPNSPGEMAVEPGRGGPGGPGAAGPAQSASRARPAAARPAVAPGARGAGNAPRPAADQLAPVGRPANLPPELAQCQSDAVAAAPARASGPQAPAPLRPGMFARVVTVFSVNDAALVVPEEAIVPQGGRQFVFKVVEPAALPSPPATPLPPDTKLVSQRQEVKLGARRQGKVEITDGLTEGQTVVVAGQQRLQRDGTPLRVVELGRPPQGAASAASAAGAASAASAAASGASR